MSTPPDGYAGIDRQVMLIPPRHGKAAILEQVLAVSMRIADVDRPMVELHNPRCPKWTSQGRRACRCGTALTEGVFEDALGRGPRPRFRTDRLGREMGELLWRKRTSRT